MRLLKFYASWCNPCKQQSKILESLELDFVESIDVDEDENQDLVDKFKVRGLPTIILLNDNEEIMERFSGITSAEVINETLKKYEQKQSIN